MFVYGFKCDCDCMIHASSMKLSDGAVEYDRQICQERCAKNGTRAKENQMNSFASIHICRNSKQKLRCLLFA